MRIQIAHLVILFVLVRLRWVVARGLERDDDLFAYSSESKAAINATSSLLVPLTLIPSAVAKGAVCLDGTPPGYHFHPGFGSGANKWIIDLEGGGWCNNLRTCVYRRTSRHGSSNYMEKQIPFNGILSNKLEENPDFYNWNKVVLRYCDGASFAGEGYNKDRDLYFRGQRIWWAAMDEFMSKLGMKSANMALLTGCSAGGLASILHCDEFRALFPSSTYVKCLADAGFFLDVLDVTGRDSIKAMFQGVVDLQGVAPNLPKTCTHNDRTLCFFPQNIVSNIQTPTFILNSAYDVWQIMESLAPNSADPDGKWKECKFHHLKCNDEQLEFLQKFRSQMLDDIAGFSTSNKNGVFINSCFTHCQSETKDTWHSNNSPTIANKGIAESVGNWYFDRAPVKAIDCPYPCDKTCHHLF